MKDLSFDLSLLDPEEREELEYIWQLMPEQDRQGLTKEDVLYVLDRMDDYLEEKGLLSVDEEQCEVDYVEGDVDETEQLEFVLQAIQSDGVTITSQQVQLIMDGELQYGIENGWYEEE